jgi:hypothetical protein
MGLLLVLSTNDNEEYIYIVKTKNVTIDSNHNETTTFSTLALLNGSLALVFKGEDADELTETAYLPYLCLLNLALIRILLPIPFQFTSGSYRTDQLYYSRIELVFECSTTTQPRNHHFGWDLDIALSVMSLRNRLAAGVDDNDKLGAGGTYQRCVQ